MRKVNTVSGIYTFGFAIHWSLYKIDMWMFLCWLLPVSPMFTPSNVYE